jgi:hypothetical protein
MLYTVFQQIKLLQLTNIFEALEGISIGEPRLIVNLFFVGEMLLAPKSGSLFATIVI